MKSQLSLPVLVQLYRLLTLRETDFFCWLCIAFFWLIGLAVPTYFAIANFFLFTYYYLRVLPVIGSLLKSHYGRFFFSPHLRASVPTVFVILLTLLTLPGLMHYANLPYVELLSLLLCCHALLHTIVFSIKAEQSNFWLVLLILILQINPGWLLQLAEPYSIALLLVLTVALLLYLATRQINSSQVVRNKTNNVWRFWLRPMPRNHASLANSLLFQNNAKLTSRIVIFSVVCFTLPLVNSLINYCLTRQWLWRPDNGWLVLDDFYFIMPLFYWYYFGSATTGRLSISWLHLPVSRQNMFGYIERYCLLQLVIFSMPIIALLYFWQPANPNFAASAILTLCTLVFLTYSFLCFFNNNAVAVASGLILYGSMSHWLFLSKQSLQLEIAVTLVTASLALRFIAIKRWPKLNLSKLSLTLRKRHV
tara:strand:+ start:169 stop:1431 length:1263 start_codon:yes stop_codon:yes gene_type:complete